MSGKLKAGVQIADAAGLADGATRGFVLGEGEWPVRGFLVRSGDAIHAYVNRCPHAGRQLNYMPDRFLSRDGTLIQCVAHGALFEKETGECVAGPCVGDRLRRIPVRVAGAAVLLEEDVNLDDLAKPPW